MHYRCGKTKQTVVVWSCVEKGKDWVSECKSLEVNGVEDRGKGRKDLKMNPTFSFSYAILSCSEIAFIDEQN